MQSIIENTSSDELLIALDSNMIAFYSAYGRANGCTLQLTPDAVWFYTGIQVAILNGVVSAKLNPENVKATFNSLQRRIDEEGAPALWWIGPQSQPDHLGTLLERYGLQPAGEVPGMAIDLELLENKPEMPANFVFQKVNTTEMQALWARIAAVGTGFPDVAVEAMEQLEVTMTDPQYKAQYRYIGFLNGIPVATSALVLNSGVAGIYAVATIPEARRKGFGKIMTVMPLLEARQIGYRVGILQASSMGYPIYKKIGFLDVCMYKTYLQSKKK
jgi:GNAT superfamily N-acetyltransferase